MRTKWTARTVTDVVGTAGSVVLEDWLHDYYEGLDAGDTAWVEYDSEWSAERSAEAIYEYMRDR